MYQNKNDLSSVEAQQIKVDDVLDNKLPVGAQLIATKTLPEKRLLYQFFLVVSNTSIEDFTLAELSNAITEAKVGDWICVKQTDQNVFKKSSTEFKAEYVEII